MPLHRLPTVRLGDDDATNQDTLAAMPFLPSGSESPRALEAAKQRAAANISPRQLTSVRCKDCGALLPQDIDAIERHDQMECPAKFGSFLPSSSSSPSFSSSFSSAEAREESSNRLLKWDASLVPATVDLRLGVELKAVRSTRVLSFHDRRAKRSAASSASSQASGLSPFSSFFDSGTTTVSSGGGGGSGGDDSKGQGQLGGRKGSTAMIGSSNSTGNEKGALGLFLKRMYHQLDIHVSSSGGKFPLVLFVLAKRQRLVVILLLERLGKLIRESEK